MAPKSAVPPPAAIPPLKLSDGLTAADVNAAEVVSKWLTALQERLDSKDLSDLSSLFIEDSWWRDLVALTWDTRTQHGVGSISKYLSASDHGLTKLEAVQSGALQPALLNNGGMIWIQSGYSFQTKHGSGRGVVHLVNVSRDEWKAWMVLTQMEKLNSEGMPDWGITENGVAASAFTTDSSTTTNGTANGISPDATEPDYQVIIIGAGQGGLALAAHLQNKGLKYLVVDKVSRVGDSWRARYKTITSHTPKYTDHFPFLPYPSNYPKWLNQEKITNWLESYAQIMELRLRLNTEVKHVTHDGPSRTYTLTLSTPNSPTPSLTARHVVLAAGMFGLNPIIPGFPSSHTFKGTIYHAKQHSTAVDIPDLRSKKVAIVGAGTSAHDIAEDFAAHGAKSVTLVQRSPIFAVSRASAEKYALGMWDKNVSGMGTEEADLVGQSFPFAVVRSFNVGQTMGMCAEDKGVLDRLVEGGMRIKRGETGEGLVDHQLIKGGCFYIDQGAWRYLLDGRIGVGGCEEGVVDMGEKGVVLGDGRTVDADVVVLATGYERCWTTVGDLLGEEALETVGRVSETDEEGERIGWWRPTGLKGFWYMTGSFIWTRQFSAVLALQIDAVERGLNERYWEE